jgi:AraC-like DNA-binding protein
LKMEQTMSANLEPTRYYDDALTAPLAAAMAYDGGRPAAQRSSFATLRVEERLEEKPASHAETGLDEDRLQRVLDYIAAHLRSDLTLEKLAAVACYSPFHFARKFTIAVDVPPQRYIGRLRLEMAMEELGRGKLPLAEIALNANFSSQASFTRAFRRATGTTPNEYRRRTRREAARSRSARAVEAHSHGHW